MKLLIFLALLGLFLAFLYWRLRPYIAAARRMLGFVRDIRGMSGTAERGGYANGARESSEKLVRCQSCGTWTPAARAVALRGPSYYCSHACLERAAEGSRPRAAGRNRR
ncbi:MAG TPA: hypothetical protein VF553_05030 [Pyrinomonadaceae bacterium]